MTYSTIGHDFKSCMAKLLPIVIGSLQHYLLKDRRLILMDTPGFNLNRNVNDADVLDGIPSWIETMYDSCDSHGHKGKRMLTGITVYFHDMPLTRIMLGSTVKNLDIFQKLCRKDPLKRVVLCTTKVVGSGISNRRRKRGRLSGSRAFTARRLSIDSRSTCFHKFKNSQKSAWDVIALIIKEDRL